MDFVEVSIRFNPSSPLRVWFSLVKFILEICSGNPKHLIGLDFDSLRGCPLSPWVTLIQSSCISILTLVICVAFPLSPHVGLIVLQKKGVPYFRRPLPTAGGAHQRRGDKRRKRQEEGLPWCFGLAGGFFDRSCAGRKPAAIGRKQVGSKKHGALTRPAQDEGQLQAQASKLAASSAGKQANWTFEASV